MVLVEEINDDEEPTCTSAPQALKPKTEGAVKLKKGFLGEQKESLYPPEGSSEGKVHADTHKAHTENKYNQDINKSMNKGAAENNGIERPAWYTKDWPKDCQYNAPGCYLNELDSSTHQSAVHREMARGARWEEAFVPGATRMTFSFNSITDEEMGEIAERLKGNKDVVELDLTHNKIKDAGVQKLVGALAAGAAPNLKELRIHGNEFTELGKVMLSQGLKVFRKKLEIQIEEPSWMKEARESVAAKKAAEAEIAEPAPEAEIAANEMD